MENLKNYFGKESKKSSKKGIPSKPAKKIASSSDESPLFIEETKPSKRRSKPLKIISDEEPIVETLRPIKKRISVGKAKSRLYETISHVDSQKQYDEIDPENYFESQPINNALIMVDSKNIMHNNTKNKRKSEILMNNSESIFGSPSNDEKVAPEKKKKIEKDSKARDNIPGYIQAMQRAPPQKVGQRSLPVGCKNCLEGLIFVISGILEYFERDEIISLIQRYGGKSTTSISRKTSYLVVGREPGESKLKKSQELNTQILNEDEFYRLIADSKSFIDEPSTPVPKVKVSSTPVLSKSSVINQFELWVEKYKPKSLNEIVGQHGPKSPANKLLNWLKNWDSSRSKTAAKNFFASKEDGSIFKASLLSGAPGLGKTTTATLVCQQLGYDIVELNASDTRSKKCLEGFLSVSLQNFRITKLPDEGKSVLIMDEVDGMSGNQDRGGIQELINMIKSSNVPIICICNDRMHPKIRSLSNYCFDLRFNKPRVEQIKSFVLSIASKEGIDIEPQAAEQMVIGGHSDIRMILNNLQMWSVSKNVFNYDDAKKEAKSGEKDSVENIFEVVRKLFTRSSKISVKERADLFFVDYSIISLFVFENYPFSITSETGICRLKKISYSADSISAGALCENIIRGTNNWSLLPTQAILSCVIPSECMAGVISGLVKFPQWLGKNSTSSKNNRILQQLTHHAKLKCGASKSAFLLDMIPFMNSVLYLPLIENQANGVDEVITRLLDYDLIREDWDSIIDLYQWSTLKLQPIDTKTKSAFTRTYNKIDRQLPFVLTDMSKFKSKPTNDSGELEEPDSDDSHENKKTDMMFKIVSTPVNTKKKAKTTRKVKT